MRRLTTRATAERTACVRDIAMGVAYIRVVVARVHVEEKWSVYAFPSSYSRKGEVCVFFFFVRLLFLRRQSCTSSQTSSKPYAHCAHFWLSRIGYKQQNRPAPFSNYMREKAAALSV